MHPLYLQSVYKQLKGAEQKRVRNKEDILIEEQATKNLENNQEKDKYLYDSLNKKGILVGDTDQGKVSMYVSMTLNQQLMPETK